MLVALVLLLGGLAYSQFAAFTAQAQIEVHRKAHVVATQFSWVFQASAQALQRVEEAVAATSDGRITQIRNISEAVRDLPAGYQHSVYDPQGRLILTSVAQPKPINVSDRDYFLRLKAGSELVISPMVTERLSGQKVIIVGRRLDRGDRFAGIATIAIPVKTLADLAEILGVTEGSTLSLVGTDGMLIARAPPVEPLDLSASALFGNLKKAPDGSYASVSSVDRVARIVGYWQMAEWPVIAVVGLEKKAAYLEFWHQMKAGLVLLLPVILFATWLGFRLLKQMRIDEQRQQDLMAVNERANFLLREIHHRVKNNLQTVMSLIRLAHLPEDVKSSILGRIAAMVAVHVDMYASDRFETVDVADFLTRLVRNIASGYGTKVALTLDVAPVELTGDRATQLGLLTNELVANAFKHAFAKRGHGTLSVSLQEIEPGWLRLVVSDDGPGFDPAAAKTKMGSKLVEAFAEQLGGRIGIRTNGHVTTTVDFPRDYRIEPG